MSALAPLAAGSLQWLLWGSGLALAVFVLAKVAGDRRAEIQDLLFRSALALQAFLLALSIGLSLGDVPPAPEAPQFSEATVARGRQPLNPVEAPASVSSGSSVREAPAVTGSLAEIAIIPEAASVSRSIRALRFELSWPRQILAAGLALYVGGVLVGLGFLVREWARLVRLRALGSRVDHPALLQAMERSIQRLRVLGMPTARPPDLLTSPFYGGVLLVGLLRPAILFPTELLGRLSASDIESILAHELAHWRRRDIAWFACQRLVAILSWPVPFQRWILSAMGRSAEVLCDREASLGTSAEGYARALVEVLRFERGSEATVLTPAAVSSKSFARRRIEMVLAIDGCRYRLGFCRGFALSVLTAALALPPLGVQIRAGPAALSAESEEVSGAQGAGRKRQGIFPEDVFRLIPSDPETGAEERGLSEEVRKAQARLAEFHLQKGTESYRAGEFEKARASFAMAAASKGLESKVYPITEKYGLLPLHSPRGSVRRAAIEKRFGKLDTEQPSPDPVLDTAVEKRSGRIAAGEPGTFVDLEYGGFMVLDRKLLEEIRQAFLPRPDERRMVTLAAVIFDVKAKEAERWSQVVAGAPRDSEWLHELKAEETSTLRKALEAKDGSLQVLQTPFVAVSDGQECTMEVSSQVPYTAKYDVVTRDGRSVADPVTGVVDSGTRIQVLPFIEEGSRVRLLLRAEFTKLKEMKEARIDLAPHGTGLPVQIPVLERETVDCTIHVSEGEGVLLGRLPTEEDKAADKRITWGWVRIKLSGKQGEPSR